MACSLLGLRRDSVQTSATPYRARSSGSLLPSIGRRRSRLRVRQVALATVVLALVGSPGPAVARERARRFHAVTEELFARLPEPMGANVAAVGQYLLGGQRLGTAFLITEPGPDRTALALTNQHVAKPEPGDWRLGSPSVRFGRYREAPVMHAVASSDELDYAVVQIRMPKGQTLHPIPVARGERRRGERVYVVGFPSLAEHSREEARRAVGGPEATRDLVLRDRRRLVPGGRLATTGHLSFISLGKAIGEGRERGGPSYRSYDALCTRGSSGSPILSCRSDAVVALAYAYEHTSLLRRFRSWLTGRRYLQDRNLRGVPIETILEDLSRKLADGEVSDGDRPQLEAFIDQRSGSAPPR